MRDGGDLGADPQRTVGPLPRCADERSRPSSGSPRPSAPSDTALTQGSRDTRQCPRHPWKHDVTETSSRQTTSPPEDEGHQTARQPTDAPVPDVAGTDRVAECKIASIQCAKRYPSRSDSPVMSPRVAKPDKTSRAKKRPVFKCAKRKQPH